MTKHVHFIGIGGTGLSAIARVLLESGWVVSGSDRSLSPLANEVAAAGARVFAGHSAEHVRGADVVVRSSAVQDDNPEVLAARAAGIPVLKRSEFLNQVTSDKTILAVTGTHGKTTTTAMLAWALKSLEQDPSYIIGGVSKDLAGNAHAGSGPYFVIEADEYDRMFLGLHPTWAVLTNLEHDHPDCFPTMEEYRQAFASFVSQLQPGGGLLACADDVETSALAGTVPSHVQKFLYGTRPPANYLASDVSINPHGAYSFDAYFAQTGKPAEHLARVELQAPGRHNVLNAVACLGLIHQLGLDVNTAGQALGNYRGTARRFEVVGSVQGITLIDDYAHNPTKIRAALEAARSRYPGQRVWAVWQPHTYSRTQTLLDLYLNAFSQADQVLVTEIYAAREKSTGFSAAQVVERMPHAHARFTASLQDAVQTLTNELQPGDVVLVLSAGDADWINPEVLRVLNERQAQQHG